MAELEKLTEHELECDGPAISNVEPQITLYNLLCAASGYEPRNVYSLEVRFEVGEPVKFTVQFRPKEDKVQQAVTSFIDQGKLKQFCDSIREK